MPYFLAHHGLGLFQNISSLGECGARSYFSGLRANPSSRSLRMERDITDPSSAVRLTGRGIPLTSQRSGRRVRIHDW